MIWSKKIEDAILILIVLIVLAIILPRLFLYTPSGDIDNIFKDITIDSSDEELTKNLYKLSIYKYSAVRWHYYFALSLIGSFIILYFVKRITLINFIVVALILFIIIDLPVRFVSAHQEAKIVNEATQIYGALQKKIIQQ